MTEAVINSVFVLLKLLVLWSIVFSGFGLLVLACFNRFLMLNGEERAHLTLGNIGKYDFFLAGLVGIPLAGFLSVILNFWFAISTTIVTGFCIVGVLFFVYFRKHVQIDLKILPLVFLTTAVLIFFGMTSLGMYDLGLYHIQYIKWINSYPAPLGLANIHSRFGFNSIWHATAAMMKTPIHSYSSVFLINLLTGSLFFGFLANCLSFQKNMSAYKFWLLTCLLLTFSFDWSWLIESEIFGPTTGFPGTVYGSLAVIFLINALDNPKQPNNLFWISLFFCVFFVCCKLSNLIFLVLWFPFLASFLIRQRGIFFKRHLFIAFVFIVCLLAPHFIRGFILSGCFLFPADKFCFGQFQWSIPIEKVKQIFISNYNFNHSGVDMSTIGSSLDSLKTIALGSPIVLVAAVLCCATGCRFFFSEQFRKTFTTIRSAYYGLFICLVSIIFWFQSAPNFRFGNTYFLVAFCLLIGLNFSEFKIPRFRLTFLYAVATVGAVYLVFFRQNFTARLEDLSVWPRSSNFYNHRYQEMRTVSGKTVNVSTIEQCFDVKLPCILPQTHAVEFDYEMTSKNEPYLFFDLNSK